MKELINIQSFLKAPKDKRNTFGGYNYRSCESVLEAVKPLLKAEACTLTINDDIVQVGERYYIKATATLRNSSGESVSATALAREEETKKGMDGAQVTGAASSYARKYALNGLFAIDDTKDPDTDEHYKRTHQADQPKPKAKLVINDAMIDNKDRLGKMLKVLEAAYAKDPQGFAVIRHLRDELGAEFEDNADKRVLETWMQHVVENHL